MSSKDLSTFTSQIDYLTAHRLEGYNADYEKLAGSTEAPEPPQGMTAMVSKHFGPEACRDQIRMWYNELRQERPAAREHLQTSSGAQACHTVKQTYAAENAKDPQVAVESRFMGDGVEQDDGTLELCWRGIRETWHREDGSTLFTAESVYDELGIFRSFVYNGALQETLSIKNGDYDPWTTRYTDTRGGTQQDISKIPGPLRRAIEEFISRHTQLTKDKLGESNALSAHVDLELMHEQINRDEEPPARSPFFNWRLF